MKRLMAVITVICLSVHSFLRKSYTNRSRAINLQLTSIETKRSQVAENASSRLSGEKADLDNQAAERKAELQNLKDYVEGGGHHRQSGGDVSTAA